MAFSPTKVFFPTDFSKNAQRALPFAATIASAAGAELILFHASQRALDFAPDFEKEKKKAIEEASKEFDKMLSQLNENNEYRDLKISTILQSGHPAVGLLSQVEETGADLIVMGTKGATANRSVLFGSIASSIINKSDIHLLAVPPEATLEEAAVHKLDTICRKLDLRPDDEVMEIGTGWGGFAIHAARHYGCHVTTTTISREQFDLATERVAAEGLSDRITLLFDDYRDLTGQYDKLVSIEMIEAVGPQYLDSYLAQIDKLLKPDGLALIQAINMPEQRYRRALKNVDFIQRFIFPGSFIPSFGAILESVRRESFLVLSHAEDLGFHYARTLRDWHNRFNANRDHIAGLGYGPEFQRLWQFYFAYCEAGFSERAIGVAQILLAKPGNRRDNILSL